MRRMLKLAVLAGTAVLLCTGCNRMTPEERLEKIAEAMQQGDALGAELEAKKLIEKHPDDPATAAARMQLAQIYTQDGRLDEAAAEYQTLLDQLPPGSYQAIRLLSLYNQILKQQKRFPDALALVEKYEKEFTTSPEVMMNMRVARADLKIAMNETTEARTLLKDAMGMTTHPVAQMQFRELYVSSLMREGNTTGVVEFLQEEVGGGAPEELRRDLAYRLAAAQAQVGTYAQTRQAVEQATTMTEAELRDELDRRAQAQVLLDLAGLYEFVGNLKGSLAVLQSLLESNPDPALASELVPAIFRNLLRQGRAEEAMNFVRKAAERYKIPQFTEQVAQANAAFKAGKFDQKDTSPLVLAFEADPPLVPANLPQGSAGVTTGTATAAGETTGPVSGGEAAAGLEASETTGATTETTSPSP